MSSSVSESNDIEGSEVSSQQPEPGGTKEVWLLAYPIILANISETLMGTVDTFMVAQLGTVEVAAVGLGDLQLEAHELDAGDVARLHPLILKLLGGDDVHLGEGLEAQVSEEVLDDGPRLDGDRV